MDAGFDFGFQGSTVGFVTGRGRPVAFNRYLDKREEVRPGHFVSHYLSSHDTDGAIHTLQGDLDLFRMCAALQLTARGIPCIMYGEEVGRRIGTWPDNRNDMPWDGLDVGPGRDVPRDEGLRQYYKQLIAIRRAHPAIWRGEREGLDFGKDHLVFARHDAQGGDRVLVAANRAAEAVDVTVALPEGWGPTAHEVLAGVSVQVTDGRLAGVHPREDRPDRRAVRPGALGVDNPGGAANPRGDCLGRGHFRQGQQVLRRRGGHPRAEPGDP